MLTLSPPCNGEERLLVPIQAVTHQPAEDLAWSPSLPKASNFMCWATWILLLPFAKGGPRIYKRCW